jgi:bifunctional lysine-specific demethylase and histidyl-hydroxylase NO66
VDAALTGGGLRRPAVRLVRDGAPLDPASWTRNVRTGSVTVDDAIDPARVLDHFAGGATIVLQSLQRWWPPVARFCRDLETVLTHAVQANAYLTPAGAAGLAPHHDTHDVFVMQLHGTKRWVVREALVEAPLSRHRSNQQQAAAQEVLFEAELRPGACLYLPRGVVHSARAQEATSLHLTIGILATTGYDVVQRIATLAAGVPALRRTLPPGWANDPATAAAVVKEVLAEFVGFTQGVDPGDVASHLATRHLASRQPLLDGQLLQLDALGSLADSSLVARRAGVVVVTDRVPGALRLRAGDRTIELPDVLEPAVGRLLDGAVHPVGGLADLLDTSSRLVLVRRLVREGLLVVVGGASIAVDESDA